MHLGLYVISVNRERWNSISNCDNQEQIQQHKPWGTLVTATHFSPSKGSADSTLDPYFEIDTLRPKKKWRSLSLSIISTMYNLELCWFDLHNTAHLSCNAEGARHADWLHLSKKRWISRILKAKRVKVICEWDLRKADGYACISNIDQNVLAFGAVLKKPPYMKVVDTKVEQKQSCNVFWLVEDKDQIPYLTSCHALNLEGSLAFGAMFNRKTRWLGKIVKRPWYKNSKIQLRALRDSRSSMSEKKIPH